MVSDADRRDLHEALERELGRGPATTLMELLPPFGWSEVARQSDLVAMRGELAEVRAELKGEMAELRSELKGEMAGLRSELKGEMAGLRSELKGEMAELRAKIAGQLPRLIAANIASMIGVAALVLAAAKLA